MGPSRFTNALRIPPTNQAGNPCSSQPNPLPQLAGVILQRGSCPRPQRRFFQSWRYIFTEENMKLRRAQFVVEEGYESIFTEWAELSLKEPEQRKRMGSNSTDDESPK